MVKFEKKTKYTENSFPVKFEKKIKYTGNKIPDELPHAFFLGIVLLTAVFILYFVGFIFYSAIPVFESQGIINFITGDSWNNGNFGIRNFIVGTLIITAVTIILAVPPSIFTAIFLSEFASPKVVSVFRPLIELLVGIPSVVYGIFGLYVLADILKHVDPIISSIFYFIPFMRDTTPGQGDGVFLSSVVLSIMILPTIITISEDSIRAVPGVYREASFALGATKWETIRHVVLPAASGGILSAVVLGIMRAMGETMAVVMLIGNINRIPSSIFGYTLPMTTKIVTSVGENIGNPDVLSALFGIAAVLFALEILLAGFAKLLVRRCKY
ncbi:TPA: phosphate ABC transporter permease subunit PstC [Methanosarcina acetivorans]|nr:phosphate ABC transporter permease subunit PstC [Methanosarcina acetivorans]HIH95653.1 phosphate ABC transporter permease subunit PstC [Methanosarcina acetivorans]